jgi:2'-5' RNA ligase
MSESALIVVVPEAESHVQDLRRRYDPVASIGVPAHITILVPFIPPDQIGEPELCDLAELFARVTPFSFTLQKVRRFPETTYLAPEPCAPLIELTERVMARFPEYPPYGGRFSEVIPHLTVADKNPTHAADAEDELTRIMAESGAISVACSHAQLYENTTGVWTRVSSFAFRRGFA